MHPFDLGVNCPFYDALQCFVTHNDVSCFDKLEPGLPNNDVNNIH